MKTLLSLLLPVSFLTILATQTLASDSNYYIYSDQGISGSSDNMQQHDFNSLYLRFAGGMVSSNLEINDQPVPMPSNISSHLAVGLSHVWDKFYAGLEGEFRYNFALNKTAYSSIVSSKVDFNTNWGGMVTAQFGGLISNSNVIYFDGGYAASNFVYQNNIAKNPSVILHGPTLGVGASLQLSDHFNFDINDHFILYHAKKVHNAELKLNQNIVTAGISFHF